MSGDLIIGGGGSTAVATAELFSRARDLAMIGVRLHDCLAELSAVDRGVTAGMLRDADAPLSAASAERDIRDAIATIGATRSRLEHLGTALELSAERYGEAEDALHRLGQQVAAGAGYLFGLALPTIALVLLPAAVGFLGGAASGYALLSAESRRALGAALPVWFRRNSRALSDPGVVEAVRLSVMSADDVGAGVLRIPPDLARLVGDEGLGLVGLGTSASVARGAAGRLGALRETGVTVERALPVVASPAVTFAERAARIPEGDAQVRIDRYRSAGEADRFEVYIGGTRDFSVVAGTEPWDMTSNVAGIAGQDAGSSRAVREAMAAAGVSAASPVVFTGYSQGGLVAAQIAASGDYNAGGLFTLGAPAAQVAVPTSVPWLAVEHTDDIVPALGGTWASADPVLARRELFAGAPVDTSVAFPAHQLSAYRQTAALVDASGEARVERTLGALNSPERGATVESTLYTATRVRP
ncbi:hypothetical protein [Lacisediminihabitans profunda]|uniref:Alpha/beta hydrolase n=1 Tax=Lacisediminihabitans profunda TaxID=2594790 RepID=A0A5C8UPJ4_9MICO|nr:hypothetical protein [Lacisediminihabitans profunda]TXN29254.1 hypothetical protein FVP33_13820 [Lacisediminihabitans profunda]